MLCRRLSVWFLFWSPLRKTPHALNIKEHLYDKDARFEDCLVGGESRSVSSHTESCISRHALLHLSHELLRKEICKQGQCQQIRIDTDEIVSAYELVNMPGMSLFYSAVVSSILHRLSETFFSVCLLLLSFFALSFSFSLSSFV